MENTKSDPVSYIYGAKFGEFFVILNATLKHPFGWERITSHSKMINESHLLFYFMWAVVDPRLECVPQAHTGHIYALWFTE